MIFNNYKIVRKAVNLNLVNFIKDYFILKRDAVAFMNKHNIIDQNEILGTWADKQIPNTYSHYADHVMETLLIKMIPIIKKHTKLNLVPTYSYARIYKNGDELKRHKDRGSCELSTTVHLGGDPWPIYLEPSGKEGLKGKKVNLKPGDMLVYKGCELEHWRNIFKGKQCLQVFLHYNDVKSKFATTNKFDTRPMLGLPTYFKQF
jgi:hypothetical protein|tara:strand:- start:773 stop:1384 length:612 start_codon:yes stop_codon:yes gene_type:complete